MCKYVHLVMPIESGHFNELYICQDLYFLKRMFFVISEHFFGFLFKFQKNILVIYIQKLLKILNDWFKKKN